MKPEAAEPRERVLSAVKGEEVFPIPVDVMENLIYPDLEARLCQHFNLAEDDHEGVLRALGAHFRWAKPAYIGPPLEEATFQLPSSFEVSFPAKKAARGIWGTWEGVGTLSEVFDRPLKSVETVADIEAYAWPDPNWFDYTHVGWIHDDADAYLPVSQWAERHCGYARVGVAFELVFTRILDLFGMETGLMHMATRPDLIQATVAHIGEFLEEHYRRIAQVGQGYFDFLYFIDDFAGQGGMLLSPQKWKEYFLPLWKRLFAIVHAYDMKVLMHMCGAVRPVLGELIDAGLDVFAVVQTTAVGMDAAELKREFGADLTFYGGVDTQRILPYGSPDDVRREVRRLADILGKGGRYVLSSSHLLMDEVPLGNVLAMYDEACLYQPHWPDKMLGAPK